MELKNDTGEIIDTGGSNSEVQNDPSFGVRPAREKLGCALARVETCTTVYQASITLHEIRPVRHRRDAETNGLVFSLA